jgi:hypothetical protein
MAATTTQENDQTKTFTILVIAFAVITLAALAAIVGIAIGVTSGGSLATTVEVVRDLFVILLAFVLLLIGVAFTVLLIQVARFANLLQNEVRPILDSSTEAVNTIRGTAAFLSENVVEPVMQMNAMMAGARQAMDLMRDLGSLRDLATAAAQASQGNSKTPRESSESGS